jgi:hypothetical protein
VATLTTFGLCARIPYHIWFYFGAFQLLGLVFYFGYGNSHSVVNLNFHKKSQEEFVEKKQEEIELQ